MSLQDYFEQRAREGTWGALYDGAPNATNYNFLTRRAAVATLLEGDGALPRVLDVGCGTGDYVEIAARHGGVYHGVDFAPGMVQEGARRAVAKGQQARFVVGDGGRLPFVDGVFDLVLALGYIAYFHDPGPALAEMRRVLRPGGVLVAQSSKTDLCGTLDRWALDPLHALLRRSRRAPLPAGWVAKRYPPRALDALVAGHGFRRTGRVFSHFHPLPRLLRRRYPRLYIGLSEAMTRSCPSLFRGLAVDHVGRYVREA